MQNLMQKVPPQSWPAFKALVADLRDAPTFEEGHRRLQALLAQYQGTFPEACRCLADDAEASLNHLGDFLKRTSLMVIASPQRAFWGRFFESGYYAHIVTLIHIPVTLAV
jgi:hypothetical protein